MERDGSSLQRLLHARVDPLLEWFDVGIYAAVAVLFLVVAVVFGVYSVVQFLHELGTGDFPDHVNELITNLLLVLIILEVVGTVRSYLTTGATSLRPFLYIGIISAVRRILEIGASTALKSEQTEAAFRHRVIELGVDAVVVLALAVALYLLNRRTASAPAVSDEVPDPEVAETV